MKWKHWHLMATYATAALMFLAVACAGDAAAPATAQRPAITPTIAPLAVPDYAEACGTVVGDVLEIAEIPERRAATFADIAPPVELQAFHEARSEFFALQAKGKSRSSELQATYDRQMDSVLELPPEVRGVLVEESCLAPVDIVELLRALRTASVDAGAPSPGVAEYAETCGSLVLGEPLGGSLQEIFAYAASTMREWEPPKELEGYHAAAIAYYVELQKGDDDAALDPHSPALRLVAAEIVRLEPATFKALHDSGCSE